MPHEWETFYFMVGSSAAALIGLVFVVITLTSDVDPARAEIGSQTFVTPTVYHFGAVLFVSAVSVMPELPPDALTLAVAFPAVLGLGWAAMSLYRMVRRVPTKPHWTDYIFYGILPAAAYIWLILSAAALWSALAFAPYAVAVGALALLLVAIRDAWDLATYLAYHRQG